jgi:hypothetical protein
VELLDGGAVAVSVPGCPPQTFQPAFTVLHRSDELMKRYRTNLYGTLADSGTSLGFWIEAETIGGKKDRTPEVTLER